MELTTRTQDRVKIVKLRGNVSLGAAVDELTKTLADLIAAGDSRLILDLEEVDTVDSSGIGAFVRGLTAAKQKGGTIKLLKPTRFVVQTLKLVSLLKLFEIFEDQQKAVDSFAGQS